MWFLILKSAISGVLIAIISEVSKRYPGLGGLIASLPLVSVLGMIWLWRDRPDAANMAAHAEGTFWFVLPSLPMFLVVPFMLRHGVGFWPSLVAGCLLTIALYSLMVWVAPRFGLRL
jgi:F0F1-type ATP synthase assembly protein I